MLELMDCDERAYQLSRKAYQDWTHARRNITRCRYEIDLDDATCHYAESRGNKAADIVRRRDF
jgi:hypothetical protein